MEQEEKREQGGEAFPDSFFFILALLSMIKVGSGRGL
jgi:hypothetical protein